MMHEFFLTVTPALDLFQRVLKKKNVKMTSEIFVKMISLLYINLLQ